MNNEKYSVIWIPTHGGHNYHISLNFQKISKFQNQIEIQFFKLHFLNLNQMNVLKVTIEFD